MATTARQFAHENSIEARYRRSFECRLREVCDAFTQFSPPETQEEIALREKVVADLIAVDDLMTQFERDEEIARRHVDANIYASEREGDDLEGHCLKSGGNSYGDADFDAAAEDAIGFHGHWD